MISIFTLLDREAEELRWEGLGMKLIGLFHILLITEVRGGENDQAVTVGQQCGETEGDASNARFHEGVSAEKTTHPKQRYP